MNTTTFILFLAYLKVSYSVILYQYFHFKKKLNTDVEFAVLKMIIDTATKNIDFFNSTQWKFIVLILFLFLSPLLFPFVAISSIRDFIKKVYWQRKTHIYDEYIEKIHYCPNFVENEGKVAWVNNSFVGFFLRLDDINDIFTTLPLSAIPLTINWLKITDEKKSINLFFNSYGIKTPEEITKFIILGFAKKILKLDYRFKTVLRDWKNMEKERMKKEDESNKI